MPIPIQKTALNWRNLLVVIIAFLIGRFSGQVFLGDESAPQEVSGSFEASLHMVTEVIDGDTIIVDRDIEVRLIGVDAPERDECFYQESKDALAGLVEGEYVELEIDVSGHDNFGRLLRHVFLPAASAFEDKLLVNNWLLEQGYADIMPRTINEKYRGVLQSSRNQAITDRSGIWEACEQEESQTAHPMEANDPPPGPDYIIKGNISKDGYGKNYFPPDCPNYKRIKVDFSKGEEYFRTEEEAEAAGFEKSASCK